MNPERARQFALRLHKKIPSPTNHWVIDDFYRVATREADGSKSIHTFFRLLFEWILWIFLLIVTFTTIIVKKKQQDKCVHFCIVGQNANNDPRSEVIFDLIPDATKILHTSTPIKASFYILKHGLHIVPQSFKALGIDIFLFLWFGITRKTGITNAPVNLRRNRIKHTLISRTIEARFLQFILRSIECKQAFMIDDTRNVGLQSNICRHLDIKTTGYMHGKFNKFHLGLFASSFDEYWVWGEYFQDLHEKLKLQTLASKYVKTGILRKGLNAAVKAYKNASKQQEFRNILILEEDYVNPDIWETFLPKMEAMGGKIFFRRKRNTKRVPFVSRNNTIVYDLEINLYDSLIQNRVKYIFGSHSTVLLEATLFNINTYIVETDDQYSSDNINSSFSMVFDKYGQTISNPSDCSKYYLAKTTPIFHE